MLEDFADYFLAALNSEGVEYVVIGGDGGSILSALLAERMKRMPDT